MEALRSSVLHDPAVQKAEAVSGTVHLWGVNRSVRPLLAETMRGSSPFVLLITGDDARAEKLYQDYRFYNRDVYLYPAKDALFYYADVHGNATAAKRLGIVKRICENQPTVIIATIDGLMDRLPDLKYFRGHTLQLKVGDTSDLGELKRKFSMMGYENVPLVEASGQFSVRGGILDIFPLTEECPVRVEFFGDEIDSIREFDAESQRSIADLEEVNIFPATEYVLSEDRIDRGLERISREAEKQEKAFRDHFETEQYARLTSAVRNIETEIRDFNSTSGLDSLVTYFYGTTVSFLDYLPENTKIFVDEPVRCRERAGAYYKEFSMSMEGRLSGGYILPGQADVLYDDKKTISRIAERQSVLFSEFYQNCPDFGEKRGIEFRSRRIFSFQGDSSLLVGEIRKWRENRNRIVLVSPSQTRGRRLAQSLWDQDIPAFYSVNTHRVLKPREVMVTEGSLSEGYELPDAGLVVISESDIMNSHAGKKRRKLPKEFRGDTIGSLDELNVGDYVVHERHGIGVYKGIEQVRIDGRLKDYINIDYADGGRLFIPVDQLSMIGKYSDKDGRKPKLNKLGGTEWKKTTARVRASVDNMAEELVNLYAVRQSHKGHAFPADNEWQKEFEEMFPYDETQDQLKAIEDTKQDMESDRIMDRLICGDVGFGKTEVAIRAAFKCVQDGRQVAYLVPTTILAEQHLDTFRERMQHFPVNVQMLSRFCTSKEIRETLKGLENGSVDIVIGTHRLLSKDVHFKSLGLLIIDEEQRFGVKAKETIKEIRKTVDVLTLTATPIPRTLHMSLIGIRDMSLLEEPPVDRRPIQTYVMEYDPEIVREAINRELARQGQVYYVYNRVEDIERITGELRALLPEARIEFAHGKMRERELENIMHDFINHEIDVLVSTTIIETGMDIPNVNTIIIHNADTFGLSQLYQLRGRVGRSDRNAYAFLMYRRDKVIREEAEKRLSAIREFTELGSGYKISMKDLEIRGAGNLLGSSQSGHMEEVGYDLYVKMLSDAIRSKTGETEETDFDTSVDLPVEAYIPDTYIKNESLKLEMYKKISRVETEEDAEEVLNESVDRYGDPPAVFRRLLDVALLRAAAHRCRITEIRYREGVVQIVILNGTEVLTRNIPGFLKKYRGKVKLFQGKESGFSAEISPLVQDTMLAEVRSLVDDMRVTIFPAPEEQEKEDQSRKGLPDGKK